MNKPRDLKLAQPNTDFPLICEPGPPADNTDAPPTLTEAYLLLTSDDGHEQRIYLHRRNDGHWWANAGTTN